SLPGPAFPVGSSMEQDQRQGLMGSESLGLGYLIQTTGARPCLIALPTCRLPTRTRVPLDRDERLDQAYVDYQFVLSMRRIGIDKIKLRRIEERAERLISQVDWQ